MRDIEKLPLFYPIYQFPGGSTLNGIWANNTPKLNTCACRNEHLITTDSLCGIFGTCLPTENITCSGHSECFRDVQAHDSTQESQTESGTIPEIFVSEIIKSGYGFSFGFEPERL